MIDVNTGSFTGRGKGRLEDTITKVNVEAAEEVVRQLRLRDIGGIIVIDFIDMARATQPRPGAEDAAQGARRGQDEELRGRGLAARPGRDDAPERHRRRARDPHQALPDLRRRGRRPLRGDGGDSRSCASCARSSPSEPEPEAFLIRVNPKVAAELLDARQRPDRARGGDRQALPLRGRRGAADRHLRGGRDAAAASEIEERALPFQVGEEVLVTIEEPHMYNADDAVARVDSYIVSVTRRRPLTSASAAGADRERRALGRDRLAARQRRQRRAGGGDGDGGEKLESSASGGRRRRGRRGGRRRRARAADGSNDAAERP